jgi:uncharacterized protein (TIGR02145 family)
MQDVTKSNCPTSETAIVDDRDGHYYYIGKLSDNNCWMLTNLAYGGSEAGTQLTSGAGSTSASGGTNASSTYWDRADPPYNKQKQWVDPTNTDVTQYNGSRCDTSYRTTAALLDYTECGYLYNWCAALGSASGSCSNNSSNTNVASAGIELCPDGWELPTRTEFSAVYSVSGSGSNFAVIIFHVTPAGYFLPGGGLYQQTNYGRYWTATVYSVQAAYYLNIVYSGSISVTTSNGDHKYNGMSVRCVISS